MGNKTNVIIPKKLLLNQPGDVGDVQMVMKCLRSFDREKVDGELFKGHEVKEN